MISAALAANCWSVLTHHERRRRSCTPSLRNKRHIASSETPRAAATDAPSQLADPLGGGNSSWCRTRRRSPPPPRAPAGVVPPPPTHPHTVLLALFSQPRLLRPTARQRHQLSSL